MVKNTPLFRILHQIDVEFDNVLEIVGADALVCAVWSFEVFFVHSDGHKSK
jgi:hypothetical protein